MKRDIASTLSPEEQKAVAALTSWALTSVPLVHLEVTGGTSIRGRQRGRCKIAIEIRALKKKKKKSREKKGNIETNYHFFNGKEEMDVGWSCTLWILTFYFSIYIYTHTYIYTYIILYNL